MSQTQLDMQAPSHNNTRTAPETDFNTRSSLGHKVANKEHFVIQFNLNIF